MIELSLKNTNQQSHCLASLLLPCKRDGHDDDVQITTMPSHNDATTTALKQAQSGASTLVPRMRAQMMSGWAPLAECCMASLRL